MRETVFAVPIEIPRSQRARLDFKFQLESLAQQLGRFGDAGRSVGIGFEWQTHTGLGNGGLHAVCTLLHRVQRAFFAVGILSRQADVYPLKSRIVYIRGGEPNVAFTIQEG